MLKPAIRYENWLTSKLRETWFDERYKYYYCSPYYTDEVMDNSTQVQHRFVSVGKLEELQGYISYNIDRETDTVISLGIVSFNVNSFCFAADVHRAIKDIFDRFNFRKLIFSVVVGNPTEKQYDRLIQKYGGRIVGVHKAEVKLIDGHYYDLKVYEVLQQDYIDKKTTCNDTDETPPIDPFSVYFTNALEDLYNRVKKDKPSSPYTAGFMKTIADVHEMFVKGELQRKEIN